jgi:hypothetical protein
MLKNNLVVGLFMWLGFAACKQNQDTSTFYFSVSLEENRQVSSYVILKKSNSADTITYHYKTYDSTGRFLLSDIEERYKMKKDSIFLLKKDGMGRPIDKHPLFSAFVIGKCDTIYFSSQKMINCYEGKKDLNLTEKTYIQAHVFYEEKRDINDDFLKRRIYYDADLVPILEENADSEFRYFHMERVKSLPFTPPSDPISSN